MCSKRGVQGFSERQLRRIDDLSERVMRAAPPERRALIQAETQGEPEIRAEVLELVSMVEEDAESLLGSVQAGPPETADGGSVAGDRLGRYVLGGVIGEGGFGVVHRAEQLEPVRREVAIKVLRPGMDSKSIVGRFEAERQALAFMDHPHIARVFDAGATERGLPYFVMELAAGRPITRFCEEEGLTLPERVRLLMLVCEAVQHAHAKGIIHRDLKPSNILVSRDDEGRPVPKVIDFGIAKALEARLSDTTFVTERGQFIGTPAYISPEQAGAVELDIDTRSDVYSLGVILYELLAGAPPFGRERFADTPLPEVQRILRDERPPRPSARLGGATDAGARELDWVALRCLEKDREDRYPTASALAHDLRRFLDGEPVLAGPPSVGRRVRGFCRRNRALVVSAATIAGVLVAATGISATLAVQASRARNDAQAASALAERRSEELAVERDRAVATSEFLRSLLEAPDPLIEDVSAEAGGVRFVDVLDLASERIDDAFAGDDRAVVETRTVLAKTFLSLLMLDQATREVELGRPYADRLELDHPVRLTFRAVEGSVTAGLGEPGKGQAILREVYEALEPRADEHPGLFADVGNDLAGAFFLRRDFEAGLAHVERHAERCAPLEGLSTLQRTTLLQNVAMFRVATGDHEGSVEMLEAAIEQRERAGLVDHPYTLVSQSNLSLAYYRLGRFDRASDLMLEVARSRDRVLGPEHPHSISSHANHARMLIRSEDREAAAAYAASLAARVRSMEAPEPISRVEVLAALKQIAQDAAEEARLCEEMREIITPLPEEHPARLRADRECPDP